MVWVEAIGDVVAFGRFASEQARYAGQVGSRIA